jgi:uncharacterized protein
MVTVMDAARPLADAEIVELDDRLAGLPPPLEPLDASGLDGYLCGVLLQPRPVPEERWWRWVGDVEHGRALPPGPGARIAALTRRRHAELADAIARRRWFDPWIFEHEGPTPPPREAVQPWAAGFSAALERFPDLLALHDPALLEPLAVIFAAFEPEDLEEADDLLPVIETLEPPSTMTEAAEDIVRSVLLIADVSRPRRFGPRRR